MSCKHPSCSRDALGLRWCILAQSAKSSFGQLSLAPLVLDTAGLGAFTGLLWTK